MIRAAGVTGAIPGTALGLRRSGGSALIRVGDGIILVVVPVGITLVAAPAGMVASGMTAAGSIILAAAAPAHTWVAAALVMAEAVAIGTKPMSDQFTTAQVSAEMASKDAINAWLAAIWQCERGATLDLKIAWVKQGGKLVPAIISEIVDGDKRCKVILSTEFARHVADVAEKTMREHAEGVPEPVVNMTLALRAAADKIELMVPPEMKEVRDVAESR